MPDPSTERLKIAVVGCGVAGLTAAWLLSRRHDVHLFERNGYLGGHTRTLTVQDGPDAGTPVDTGFIVMNHRNYPHFTEVLKQLGVELADSSMTFSFTDETSGYSYSGNSFASLFPTLGHFFKSRHWAMIRDIRRFGQQGFADLEAGKLESLTLGDYLAQEDFGAEFVDQYLLPMGAAIWSSPLSGMRDFPAAPYLHFLENHGLLRLKNRPQWRYVKGGSRTYVQAMLGSFENPPRLEAAPHGIARTGTGVKLTTHAGESVSFDHVVIGTHADEALQLLSDPDPEEKRLLGAWSYQENEVVLHTHDGLLPKNRKLWSSWNFTREPGSADEFPVSVTYYMNRLQRLQTEKSYLVTLNRQQPIPGEAVLNRTVMTHPQYSFASMDTQPKLRERNGTRNTWFCGSYFGFGFHEDAVKSAVEVAAGFGIEL